MHSITKRSYLCLRTIVFLVAVSVVFFPLHSALAAQPSTTPQHIKAEAQKKEVKKQEKNGEESADEEGMSTLTKVGIGVGVVAAVGLVVGLASGSSDSSPSYPTNEGLLGAWHSEGLCLIDGRTYTGTYNFYAVGRHTYDITGEDGRKTGNGVWTLTEGPYSLRMENESGSIYVGEFAAGNYNSITMTTTDGRWQVTLTR